MAKKGGKGGESAALGFGLPKRRKMAEGAPFFREKAATHV